MTRHEVEGMDVSDCCSSFRRAKTDCHSRFSENRHLVRLGVFDVSRHFQHPHSLLVQCFSKVKANRNGSDVSSGRL